MKLRLPVLWLADALDYSDVTPQIAVGSAFSPGRVPQLGKRGFTGVVDCRAEAQDDADVLERAGLQFWNAAIRDHHAPRMAVLIETIEWVLEHLARVRGARVLIHCREGIGRSPLVASCVLVAQGYGTSAALQMVRSARPRVVVNERQLACLQAFAAAWREHTSSLDGRPRSGALRQDAGARIVAAAQEER